MYCSVDVSASKRLSAYLEVWILALERTLVEDSLHGHFASPLDVLRRRRGLFQQLVPKSLFTPVEI